MNKKEKLQREFECFKSSEKTFMESEKRWDETMKSALIIIVVFGFYFIGLMIFFAFKTF